MKNTFTTTLVLVIASISTLQRTVFAQAAHLNEGGGDIIEKLRVEEIRNFHQSAATKVSNDSHPTIQEQMENFSKELIAAAGKYEFENKVKKLIAQIQDVALKTTLSESIDAFTIEVVFPKLSQAPEKDGALPPMRTYPLIEGTVDGKKPICIIDGDAELTEKVGDQGSYHAQKLLQSIRLMFTTHLGREMTDDENEKLSYAVIRLIASEE